MEGLTKQQLVLLALLVSFVTSIATGIVTVALMDQAPQSVVQTINRVVERTVERVVPATDGGNNAAAVVTKETVVVKADDLVVSAVEKNKQYIVKINKVRDVSGVEKEVFGGLAVPVSKDGFLATDISVLAKETDWSGSVIPESYKAITADGKSFSVVPVGVDEANSLVFFKHQVTDSDSNGVISLTPVSLGNSDGLKLGQTIIAIGGSNADVISTGIVSALSLRTDGLTSSGMYSLIKTDVVFDDSVPGTILLNLSGELVGMVAGKYSGKSAYLPSNVINTAVTKTSKSPSNSI
ncbi:MAG TPA: serine protease [Candidatus Paceibacterota bacterium]